MSDLKMPDINNVLIAGNVSSEPNFRKTNNGTPVVNFYIASNRKYKDNSGIWRENTCHVGIVAWQKLAETCKQALEVGSSVLIDGELQSKSWKTDDGSTKSIVEIRARRIQFLEQQNNTAPEEPTAETKPEKTSDDDSQQKPADEPEKQNDEQHIEPTEFDFGYQDLKL